MVAFRQAKRIHRHFHMAVELPEIVGINLVLQLCNLVVELVGFLVGKITAQQFPDFIIAIQYRLLFGHAFRHHLLNGFAGGKPGFLFEVSDSGVLRNVAAAHEFLIETGHDFQQAGFARTIPANHADACTEKERQIDLFQNGFCTMLLGQVFKGIDIFTSHWDSSLKLRQVFSAHRRKGQAGAALNLVAVQVACRTR